MIKSLLAKVWSFVQPAWQEGQWVLELDGEGNCLGIARIVAVEWRLLRLDNGRLYGHDGRFPWHYGAKTPVRIIPVTKSEPEEKRPVIKPEEKGDTS